MTIFGILPSSSFAVLTFFTWLLFPMDSVPSNPQFGRVHILPLSSETYLICLPLQSNKVYDILFYLFQNLKAPMQKPYLDSFTISIIQKLFNLKLRFFERGVPLFSKKSFVERKIGRIVSGNFLQKFLFRVFL